jgi:diguanylate cyclase (GGDEF)-like protein
VTGKSGTDATALSRRVLALMIVRVALAGVLLGSGLAVGGGPARDELASTAGYLVLTGLLSGLMLTGHRRLALTGFGAALLLDGVHLTWQHELLGPQLAVDVAIAADLVAVCLLASFRTGLKVAVWQCLLLVAALRGEQQGMFRAPAAMAGVVRDRMLAAEIVMLWVIVLTTAAAAAVSERELRRRRYDAEAMSAFVLRLQASGTAPEVLMHLLSFLTAEFGAARAMIAANGPGGPEVMAGVALADGVPLAAPAPSPLLEAASRRSGTTLMGRALPATEPWIAALLAPARRLVVRPVALHTDTGWLVTALPGRGRWAERRIVTGIDQASAIAELALSRVSLLAEAERAAATDGLTGVANRRSLEQVLQRLRGGAGLGGEAVPGYAVIITDVDHFKAVNDRHGHLTGDAVLRGVAQVLADVAGGAGMVARYGGEEFCVVLPGTDLGAAGALAERLRQAVRTARLLVPVTASFGVAGAVAGQDPAEAVEFADQALIQAKRTGRDRVVVAGVVPAPRAART